MNTIITTITTKHNNQLNINGILIKILQAILAYIS